jgi:hypothetical protein
MVAPLRDSAWASCSDVTFAPSRLALLRSVPFRSAPLKSASLRQKHKPKSNTQSTTISANAGPLRWARALPGRNRSPARTPAKKGGTARGRESREPWRAGGRRKGAWRGGMHPRTAQRFDTAARPYVTPQSECRKSTSCTQLGQRKNPPGSTAWRAAKHTTVLPGNSGRVLNPGSVSPDETGKVPNWEVPTHLCLALDIDIIS